MYIDNLQQSPHLNLLLIELKEIIHLNLRMTLMSIAKHMIKKWIKMQ